jgi:hypothetical protein
MSGLENLLAGKSLVGRYRIEEVIGLGGFAAVYRAADERLGRDVAVKVITLAPPDAQSRERLRERFEHEARAAASLPHHPNVITVHDFGHDDELGLDFLVMELLRGENLAQLFKREGHLGMDVALQVLCEASDGVAVGHAAGIIHRDVKPGNIFLAEPHDDEPFRVVVLDFGIARIATDDEELTRTIGGENPLTAAYAAPEQMRGDAHLTCAADVFSLGVVGYQLLTGEKPFASGEGRRLRGRDPIRPIRELAPVQPAVEAVIERAMAEDPAARYPDAGAFRTALSEAMRTDDRTLLAPAAGLGAAAVADDRTVLHAAAAPPPPVTPPVAEPVAPRPAERVPVASSAPRPAPAPTRTRSRAPMLLVALLVLGAIAVGVWAMSRGGGREASAAPRDTTAAGAPRPMNGPDAGPSTPVTAGSSDVGGADGSSGTGDAGGSDGTAAPPSDGSDGGDGQPSSAPPSPPPGIQPTPGIAPPPPPPAFSPPSAPPSAPPPAPPSAPAPRPRPTQPQPRPQQPRPQPRPQQPQPQQPEPQQPEQPEPAPPPAPTPAPPVIVTPPTVVPAPNPNAPRDTIVIPTSPGGAGTTVP